MKFQEKDVSFIALLKSLIDQYECGLITWLICLIDLNLEHVSTESEFEWITWLCDLNLC